MEPNVFSAFIQEACYNLYTLIVFDFTQKAEGVTVQSGFKNIRTFSGKHKVSNSSLICL
jgi:hypothetical protein